MFWDKFYSLCKEKNKTPNMVCKELKISPGNTSKWKSGSVPTGSILLSISDYFDCSIDYLLERTDCTEINSQNPEHIKIISSYIEQLTVISQYRAASDIMELLEKAYPLNQVVNKT